MNLTATLSNILGYTWLCLIVGSYVLRRTDFYMQAGPFYGLIKQFCFESLGMTLVALVPGILFLMFAKALKK